MIFQKTVKAGALLYALLMMGIFALLLQFYIQGQVAAGYAKQARLAESQAYLIAQLTLEGTRVIPLQTQTEETNKKEELLEIAADSPKEQEKKDTEAVVPTSGQLDFTTGSSRYQQVAGNLIIQVTLKSGQTYSYQFPIPRNS